MTRSARNLALAAVVVLAACDSTSPEESIATPDEANATALLMSGGSVGAAFALASGPAATGSFDKSFSLPCPGGGTMSLTGKGSRTAQAGRHDVTWTVTSAQSACRIGADARAVTLEGSLTGTGTASWQAPAQGGSPTLLALSMTQSGTIKWTSGTTTTSCAISLTTAKQGDQLRASGNVCGRSVDRTTPLAFR